jgi:hypothetical protein
MRGAAMAGKDASANNLRENPLLALLLKNGAQTAFSLRGFIGPAVGKDKIRLFPRLDNLSECVEIPKSAIIHSIKAPGSSLGAVILWVKKDATLTTLRMNEPDASAQAGPQMEEVRKGRLRMRMRPQEARDPICFSVCMDCISWCDCSICHSEPV